MAHQPGGPIVKRQKTFQHNKFTRDAIPDDLVREILLRLGPDRRHAIRCGAVCKHWLSLISEHEFGDAFTRRHSTEATAILFQKHNYEDYRSRIESRFYQVQNPDRIDDVKVITSSSSFLFSDDEVIRASSGDLLLVSRPNSDNYSKHDRNKQLRFYICNGISKKRHCLPLPPRGIFKLLRCALVQRSGGCFYEAVVFCQTKDHRRHDPFEWQRRDDVRVTVFSSKTGRWGPLATVHYPHRLLQRQNVCVGMKIRPFNTAVPFKGRLYWLGEQNADPHAVVGIDPWAVLAGRRRCWQLIRLPEEAKYCSMYSLRMGACRDKLRLADLSYVESEGRFVLRVWELVQLIDKEEAEDSGDPDNTEYDYSEIYSWSLVHNAVIDTNFVVDVGSDQPDFSMLALHPNNPDVVFVQCDQCYIFRYDMALRKCEIIGKFPVREWEVSSYAIYLSSFWPTRLPSSDHPSY